MSPRTSHHDRPDDRYLAALAEPESLRLTRSTTSARALARRLMLGFVALVIAMLMAPWQQSVTGYGRVVARAPLERQQAIEAPIEGRVAAWYVAEGSRVAAGDPIAQLTDNDPELIARLERERDAVRARIDANRLSVLLTEQRIAALQTAQSAAVDAARSRADMAIDRERAAEQAVDAAKADLTAAELNLERTRSLEKDGLASTRARELAVLAEQTARASLGRAEASLAAARREVKALKADKTRTDADTGAAIQSAEVSLQSVRGEIAKAEQELAKVEVRLARQGAMTVVAPRAGTVLRLSAAQGTELVKAGDAIAYLVPDTDDRAVELWVDGLDVPLISPGRHVRLQFEGWPAIQFVGWPSAAIGTFGGVVALVDATDNGKGQFRIVVVPDPDGTPEDHWPAPHYLRQGVRANGWILLNEVSLGFELWRQFNGFPPVVSPQPPDKDKKDSSAVVDRGKSEEYGEGA